MFLPITKSPTPMKISDRCHDGDFVQHGSEAWRATLARTLDTGKRLKEAVLSRSSSAVTLLVDALFAATQGGDPVLEFLVVQVLHEAMLLADSKNTLNHCVRMVLRARDPSQMMTQIRLLRQLVKCGRGDPPALHIPKGVSCTSYGDLFDGEDPRTLFTECLLYNVQALDRLVTHFFRRQDEQHAKHDAIKLLSILVKRTLALTITSNCHGLAHIVINLVQIASKRELCDSSVPAFIPSDLIDLLMVAKPLYGHPGTCTTELSLEMWTRAAMGLLRTPIFERCYDVLPDVSTPPCTIAFTQDSSLYPLLQKWIHLCCVVASAIVSSKIIPSDLPNLVGITLPSRHRLLTLLMEQDDVLIDVVVELFRIAQLSALGDAPQVPPAFDDYVAQNLGPDQVFSDLLLVFGDDHLVLLDMLMSSETQTLDYLMTYLRYAVQSYPRCRLTWDSERRTSEIMSVVIRLRLEIQRQVNANSFPYNPKPLLRRLEELEHLHENEDLSQDST